MTIRYRHLWFATGCLTLAAGLLTQGSCDPLYLGSDVLWSATHEDGDVTEWELDSGGGSYVDAYAVAENHAITLTPDPVHRGQFAAKLTREAIDAGSGPGLYRDAALPNDAYYSAWYFVPEQYTTRTSWTITKFRGKNPDAPGQLGEGVDLNLRGLPGGDYVLVVFDHDRSYLEAPISDPPPIVRVGRWFHVETRFRVGTNHDGAVEIWLDGNKRYELLNRTTVGANGLYYTACNIVSEITPAPMSLYVDDAAISLERVTPSGMPAKE
jgi:hypothetical protein